MSFVVDGTDPVQAAAALVDAAGIGGRRVRTVVRLLTERPWTLAELVAQSTVDRRTVQSILDALGPDLVTAGERLRVAPGRTHAYHSIVHKGHSPSPYDWLLAGHEGLIERVRDWIAGAPSARRELDHVSATAESVALRALWLDATYDLDGGRVVCIGDHDLTSLALASVNPTVAVTVVDVDDEILAYIDGLGEPRIACRWADFRFGLPTGVEGLGDLVVTDPPYTPDGVRLFLARGIAALREHPQARLAMAYGFGDHPALGLKVQQAVSGLHLAYEAILPAFHRYHGAQAVGSSSDLYILRPTSRSLRLPANLNIYTHGSQSLEAAPAELSDDVRTALLAAASDGRDEPVHESPLPAVLGAAPPSLPAGGCVAVDLSADPGPWLVRVLLAINAARLAILVPNGHPDLANANAQRALTELVGAKYLLRLRRSTPGPRHAIVEAQRNPEPSVARAVLERPHGKLANVWREALIRDAAARGETLTKNEARQRIREAVPDQSLVDDQLIALPRHHLQALVARL